MLLNTSAYSKQKHLNNKLKDISSQPFSIENVGGSHTFDGIGKSAPGHITAGLRSLQPTTCGCKELQRFSPYILLRVWTCPDHFWRLNPCMRIMYSSKHVKLDKKNLTVATSQLSWPTKASLATVLDILQPSTLGWTLRDSIFFPCAMNRNSSTIRFVCTSLFVCFGSRG